MNTKIFIAGTDTEIGKTYISAGLLKYFNQSGYSTLGIKPIASGGLKINGQLLNPDTQALKQHSSLSIPVNHITPFLFEPAIAPHIAATLTHQPLNLTLLNQKIQYAIHYHADIKIIEGCGGWYTPLNHTETMADFVLMNHLPVVLVVGIRLGCINHALLSQEAILKKGVKLIGWIANCIAPDMAYVDENIKTLKSYLSTPCLGVIHYGCAPETVIEGDQLKSLADQAIPKKKIN
jgi:dethiobiotin synthetase